MPILLGYTCAVVVIFIIKKKLTRDCSPIGSFLNFQPIGHEIESSRKRDMGTDRV